MIGELGYGGYCGCESLSLETSRLLLYRDYFLLPFSFFFLPLAEDCFFRDLNAARSQV